MRPEVRILEQPGQGKGNALRAGFAAAEGEIIVMLDADGSTDPREIPAFVGALSAIDEKGLKIGMVCGASTGSVVAALFAAGMSPYEMLAKALECVFREKSMYSP